MTYRGQQPAPDPTQAGSLDVGTVNTPIGFVTTPRSSVDGERCRPTTEHTTGRRRDRGSTSTPIEETVLGADETVCMYTQRATDLIVDITAYVTAGGDITTFDGERIVETRTGPQLTTADGEQQGIGRRTPGQVTVVDVGGRVGIPDDAVAGIFNIGAVEPDQQGFVSAYSCSDDRPNTSTLNFGPGQPSPTAPSSDSTPTERCACTHNGRWTS